MTGSPFRYMGTFLSYVIRSVPFFRTTFETISEIGGNASTLAHSAFNVATLMHILPLMKYTGAYPYLRPL
jgi:hypothetical protein